MKALFLLFLLFNLSALNARDIGKDQAAPKYSTLLGEDLSGSGFHFVVGDKRYLACSLHQFDGNAPSVMGAMEFDVPIKIKGQVYTGKDTQVLAYISTELDKQEPLKFDPKVIPAIGDKVYCYNFEESYEGRIVSIAPDQRNYSVKMSKPFPAGGNSGSPVVSAVTGTVVGVLLTASDAKAAITVGFELWRPKRIQNKAMEVTRQYQVSQLLPHRGGCSLFRSFSF